ncbi:PREDICTED: sodium-coupled neutral amino acid transporter 9 isoform X1 [Myotis davidii]|uniref:sodium-coupled neutral amino acid transporter 9 isoform X1 n=1 Tax=Myotis davidii TaxID=225400 RepID=UPI000766E2D3|nr:PREDICTED: sodium-coupled neutral amino acid transporter 9 isoform X1 [Myotis davidii]XP_015418148.1 PREDICTED: sodium-coupled neutral amino acid transporter 9 isoform X1 [Myotis davidii]XP_015418149.1 PREDICTED: sodium-coupled neutral amino acid transporter 9 isoform X1 [Myotis davidii]XP_015418150.1 PREDICTED: sodium-coupled neutral amino acid transporter 9 isoform X1 [Myotis davidii]
MADLDSDSRQLLAPEADREVLPGPMNIQFESSDLRPNRPFHVEPTNIVSVSGVLQRVSDHASAMNKRIHYYSRLAAPADQALVAPDHVVPAPEERYVYSPLGSAYKLQSCPEGSGKNTSLVTIFMIWNTMMGTSILSIPWGIKQAGFTTGVCVILLMGLLTLYCCYRVLRSRATIPSVDTTAWEFPDVCRHYFGAFGQWSSLLFSLVSLVGAMIVYWVLMSNFLFNTGKFVFNFIHHINDTDAALSTNDSNPVTCPSAGSGHPDNGSAIFANATGLQQFERWWDKSRTVPFYLVGLLLPLLNFKSPSFFSKFNVLGTVSIVYLTFLVTLKAARLGFHLEFHWFTPTEFFVPEMRARFPQLTGVLTLAFFIHNCVITLLKNNKNQENNVRDLAVAYLLVTLTYLYIGVLVFASFPSPPLPKDCIEQHFPCSGPESDHCGSWREHGLSVPQHRRDHKVLGSRLRSGLCVRLPVPHLHPLPPPRGPPDVALAALPRPPHRPGPGQPGGSVLHVTLLPRPVSAPCASHLRASNRHTSQHHGKPENKGSSHPLVPEPRGSVRGGDGGNALSPPASVTRLLTLAES